MAKFHINAKGVPAPCRAEKGNCPFGGEIEHYSSREEAQKAADKVNESAHGLLPKQRERLYAAQDKKMEEVEALVDEEIGIHYEKNSAPSMDNMESSPESEINRYFKAVIQKESGQDVDLSEIDYDWTVEVEDKRSDGDYDYDGEVYEDAYDEDMDQAESVNKYYDERKEFINQIVSKIKSIDFTDTFDSQEEGVVDTLQYLYDRDIVNE